MFKKSFLVFVFSSLFVSTAYAGTWVEGVGKTPEEAQKNIANKKVKIKMVDVKMPGVKMPDVKIMVSPGACYSGKTRYKGKRGNLYVFEGLWHNHKGSCK